MISYFIQTHKRLLNAIQYPHHRYLFDSFCLDSRLNRRDLNILHESGLAKLLKKTNPVADYSSTLKKYILIILTFTLLSMMRQAFHHNVELSGKFFL